MDVRLAPGTYTITARDAKAGKWGVHGFEKDRCISIFLFEGSGSTYDFTGVTINVETKVYSSLGKFDVRILQIQGNHNVIKNLSLHDVGSVNDAPRTRATNVVMDGKNNRIEGLTMTVMGAYPYGYGELFGKGGKNIIRHRKHSAFLIRGLANHALNCTIDHQSYGHAIFMQAADQPVIEGCKVTGQMRSTNDVLAEKGTGSDADKADFMTYFGYPVPPDYMICLGEAGIRAYNAGTTWIDGKIIKRGTSNVTVLDSTIINMRAGCTLAHARGKKYVRGVTVRGCSQGFSIGSGDIVDCYADIQYGPALGFAYDRDKGVNAEITILPHEGETVNGTGHAAFIMGVNHKIILKSEIQDPGQKFVVRVGGFKNHIGGQAREKGPAKAVNIQLNNQTGFPVILEPTSESCTVQSVGPVDSRGKGNKVKTVRNRR